MKLEYVMFAKAQIIAGAQTTHLTTLSYPPISLDLDTDTGLLKVTSVEGVEFVPQGVWVTARAAKSEQAVVVKTEPVPEPQFLDHKGQKTSQPLNPVKGGRR